MQGIKICGLGVAMLSLPKGKNTNYKGAIRDYLRCCGLGMCGSEYSTIYSLITVLQ